MTIKIELPGELRTRVENCAADLDAEIALAAENHRTITSEIADLESSNVNLNHEIEQLQRDAVSSDKAASTLNIKESRLRQVNARLEELRATLAQTKPVTLDGATPVIAELVGFYFATLPEKIADLLQEMNLCHTRSRAIFAAKNLDCVICLRPIQSWGSGIIHRLATPENVAQLKAIFSRALRGQANLGADDVAAIEEAAQ